MITAEPSFLFCVFHDLLSTCVIKFHRNFTRVVTPRVALRQETEELRKKKSFLNAGNSGILLFSAVKTVVTIFLTVCTKIHCIQLSKCMFQIQYYRQNRLHFASNVRVRSYDSERRLAECRWRYKQLSGFRNRPNWLVVRTTHRCIEYIRGEGRASRFLHEDTLRAIFTRSVAINSRDVRGLATARPFAKMKGLKISPPQSVARIDHTSFLCERSLHILLPKPLSLSLSLSLFCLSSLPWSESLSLPRSIPVASPWASNAAVHLPSRASLSLRTS